MRGREVRVVEHHGSESYYVLGEGLLTESGGGRGQALAPEVEAHGAAVPLLADGAVRRRASGRREDAPDAGGGDDEGAGHARRRGSPRASPTSASSSTTTSPPTRRSVTFGEDVSPAATAAGPLARARPRLALRRRPVRPRVGPVLQRRPAAEDGHDARQATRPRPASTCRASARARRRRGARR